MNPDYTIKRQGYSVWNEARWLILSILTALQITYKEIGMLPFEENRLNVIERLVEYITDKFPQDEAPLVKNFVKQYYLGVSAEDLLSKDLEDLYAAVMSHWRYIQNRKKNEIKVRAFNPDLEKEGWESTHTIIEISCKDMPFLVDSVTMALNKLNLKIHLVIHMGHLKFVRDLQGAIIALGDQKTEDNDSNDYEAAIYIEIEKQMDNHKLDCIVEELKMVLIDVDTVVEDWSLMCDKANLILTEMKECALPVEQEKLKEFIELLNWLINDHFTFLGYEEYEIKENNQEKIYSVIPDTRLGLLKRDSKALDTRVLDFPIAAQALMFSLDPLIIGKTDLRSTVHRPAFMDFVSIKKFDRQGNFIGERRFLGLYTASAYNSSPKEIPFLRFKVNHVLKQSGFLPKSHDERALLNILETLPRDDLFQANEIELLNLSTNILHLQERQKIRLFIRIDAYAVFISCFVFLPKERFTATLGQKMKDILLHGLTGIEIELSTRFSESALARLHFLVRINPKKQPEFNVDALEQKLIKVARTWQDDFREALLSKYGENNIELLKNYRYAFSASYRENFSPHDAVMDIEYFEGLSQKKSLAMNLYRAGSDPLKMVRFKLFSVGDSITLSQVVPILENMGLKIISERPYEIIPKNRQKVTWINDYCMMSKTEEILQIDAIKSIFQEAFYCIWEGTVENDGFNRLVLQAHLTWREIMVLRAYTKYLWQTGFNFSQTHVEDAFTVNAEIATELMNFFKIRFDPNATQSLSEQKDYREKIEILLDSVANLNEDKILRRFMQVILATVRTNYYQTNEHGEYKEYFSFKLKSDQVPELPLPIPLYEIFVYSPKVEAIHLRAAKVARGGIRWSDRREDFRTEILGLMKTQQVKNAVIVPMGAKGGFVVKRILENASREEVSNVVIEGYKTFIKGLLDLTDNYQGKDIVTPLKLVIYDDLDPYLVVAADKGTAVFSDIANTISKEYQYWLGDAFASGGKTGYDHKKMGITAKGAWESVKLHFQEMELNIQNNPFTAIGIGDMGGDVFGNGMLLSEQLKLVAAFNHTHIFIDPNPDHTVSFLERKRLFNLSRSTWEDYQPSLISKGGGVYLRSAKFIELSLEAQKALDFYQDKATPNELIRAILKAPVDLFWNGGIGTYVKSSVESHIEVNDKANDALRINGGELRCRVVAEGGNLGFTQLGRVEYAKAGGRLNTDAIDNSGGVNCSDNEVNIKILLNEVMQLNDLTETERNQILPTLQNEVSNLVLKNNRLQTKAISIAVTQASDNIEMHSRLIQEMERAGKLDRTLEALPDTKEIAARKLAGLGLTRPELAVLMAYSKTLLKQALLGSTLPEDPYFQKVLEGYFPEELLKFKQYMSRHPLKREIIVTELSNRVINEMGVSFVNRLQDETGSSPSDIIRAYIVSREIFNVQELYAYIDALQTSVSSLMQHRMLQEVNRLVRRGARWFLRNRRSDMDIQASIQYFSPKIREISSVLSGDLASWDSQNTHDADRLTKELLEAKVPKAIVDRIANTNVMFSVLDIIEAARLNEFSIGNVYNVYFAIGNRLELGWLRECIKKQTVNNHWEALARATFIDDLDRHQRALTVNIMSSNKQSVLTTLSESDDLIHLWLSKHSAILRRWEHFLGEVKNASEVNFTVFAVLLRELLEMAQSD